jgi:hypothetical protein
MTTPEIVIMAIVTVVGIPAAMRNPTAAALVMSWLAGEAIYLVTGNSLPTDFYLFPDIFVLAVIMAKQEVCNLRPYRGAWHQLKCMVLERSPADRIIMLIFPVMWVLYAAPVHPFYKWWALYYLVIAQLAAAGYEAFVTGNRDADAVEPSGRSGPLLFVFPGGGGKRGRGYS